MSVFLLSPSCTLQLSWHVPSDAGFLSNEAIFFVCVCVCVCVQGTVAYRVWRYQMLCCIPAWFQYRTYRGCRSQARTEFVHYLRLGRRTVGSDDNSLFVSMGVHYEQVSRSTSRAREPESRQSDPVEVLWSSQLRVQLRSVCLVANAIVVNT